MADLRDPTTFRQLQETLRIEIAAKAAQIRELTEEREALERLLAKSRKQDEFVTRTDVTRKNSINRVIVEGSILQYVQSSKKPVSAKNIYKAARTVAPNLRDSTFRSYLHRMKARGVLLQTSHGVWSTPVERTQAS